MEQKIRIENAIPSDAEQTLVVYYKTWLDTYPNKEIGITREDIEYSYKDTFTPESIQKTADRIANGKENEKRLVAKEGNHVVGLARLIRNEDNNLLQTIYVLPEFQGKGIGQMLWVEAKKFLDPTKDTIVQVATYNQKAINFYTKLGFVDTGKRWSNDKFKMKSGARLPEMEMIIKKSK